MILKNIEIRNFRNYEQLSLQLHPQLNIIYGNNGEGKTNLLESIYVLAFTKSHRSFIDHNLIKSGAETAVLKGTILNNITYNLEIILNKTKKTLKIDNNIETKTGSYIEKMNIIIFYSEDLELIKGFPGARRKYLNLELSQISQNYYNTLNDYNKLLKIRNDYLKQLNQGQHIDEGYFDILTDYLVEKSVFLYQMRERFLTRLNKICPKIFKDIAKKDGFKLRYVPSVEFTNMEKDTIRTELKQILNTNLDKDIKFKTTLYGPHRDDFEFYLGHKNLKYYGSQGQQRVAVLALKLSEIELFKDYKQTSPIILLDDVFSELDNDKKNNLLSYIDNDMQVIITTTDLENIDKKIIDKAKLINIQNGKIIKEVK